MTPNQALATLARLKFDFGADAAARKLLALRVLARARLGSAAAVLRLHELLCFMRAYPQSQALLAQVNEQLARFARRADLRAHQARLADSGVAGTAIHYRFFAGQAQWLAQRWPAHLRLDRSDAEADERIARALPALLTRAEAAALAETKLPGYAALDRLRARGQTDAAFLLGRIAAMPGDGFVREQLSDGIDASFVLEPGPDTPARSTAHFARAPVVLRAEPPPRQRPDLRAELARLPRGFTRLALRDAAALVDLARGAMVTRARSLEAFSFADARDAWWVDDGDGLAFALIGVLPERRHPLAAYYGGLTLRNGVPIGYSQADVLGRSAALSFNTFDSFRGGEAAFSFARWLAALRMLFGTDSFSIEPYQLGQDNDEAIESGAWWFYAKLGFAPRDAATLALAHTERARLQRTSGHRSTARTLQRLAQRHLFFDFDARHPRPWLPLGELGLQAGAALSARAAQMRGTREEALMDMSGTLLRTCGSSGPRGWGAAQREAWLRLVPTLALLDVARWTRNERAALPDIARAKGGRSEREYLLHYLAHARLDAALLHWARVNARRLPRPGSRR